MTRETVRLLADAAIALVLQGFLWGLGFWLAQAAAHRLLGWVAVHP